MVEDAGIKDDDRIFLFDIGPNCEHIFYTRDDAGVEISDTPTFLGGNNE